MKISLLFSSLLFSSLLFSKDDWCSDTQKNYCKDKSIIEKKICFIAPPNQMSFEDPRAMTDRIQQVSYCEGYDRYEVSSSEAISKILSNLSEQCIEVSKIRIFGHANNASTSVGNIYIWQFDDAFKVQNSTNASCIMKASANIEYLGCNTGHGCAGRAGMYALATQLLSKGGNVVAPSNYMLGGPFNSSVNGFDQQLDYWDGKDKWTLQGVWDTPSKTLVESCKDECLEFNKLYENAKKKTTNCSETTAQKKIINRYETEIKDLINLCMALNGKETTDDFLEKSRVLNENSKKSIKNLTGLAGWMEYYKDELASIESCSSVKPTGKTSTTKL
jgi:hypothetical protein